LGKGSSSNHKEATEKGSSSNHKEATEKGSSSNHKEATEMERNEKLKAIIGVPKRTNRIGPMPALVAGTLLFAASNANAAPVDPAQQAPAIPGTEGFTLAYDDTNRNIIYYAPTNGRVALQGLKPLVGYTMLPNGDAYINAQFEYGLFGATRDRIVAAIEGEGKTAVAFPFRRAKLVPSLIDYDETTDSFCTTEPDPSGGPDIEMCSEVWKAIKYSSNGPSLGENLFVVGHLAPMGAAMVDGILQDGGDFIFRIDAEFYKAGRSFEAKVRVDFSRLYTNYQEVSVGGILWGRDRQRFIEREVLCLHKPPSRKHECGVFIEYTDLVTGETVDTPTIDPENVEQHNQIIQAAERLYKDWWDEMFLSVTPDVPFVGVPGRRLFGSRVRKQSFVQYQHVVREFTFRSPNAINVGTTEVPAGVHCVKRNEYGILDRNMDPPCDTYWEG
jgi:hypothetical protein